MSLYQCIKITLALRHEIHHVRPRTFNDFELAICLNLSQEMNHLRLDYSTMVPVISHTYTPNPINHLFTISNLKGIHLLDMFSNSRDPDVTLIHPLVKAVSTRFNLHK